jgi:hypothetical protein
MLKNAPDLVGEEPFDTGWRQPGLATPATRDRAFCPASSGQAARQPSGFRPRQVNPDAASGRRGPSFA